MRHSKGSIKRFLNDETGSFQSIEWSYLLIVTIIILSLILPNIIIIGQNVFHTQQIASYGIQKVAEHGQMNSTIANDLKSKFANYGIGDYEIYGSPSSEFVPYGQQVEVNLVTTIHLMQMPDILSFIPSKLKVIVKKVDASTVYVRS